MPRKAPTPARLEAFSDGVIAVIITIMVLELKVPHEKGLAGLHAVLPTLLVYALSFTLTGIYWINHRRRIMSKPPEKDTIQRCPRVSGVRKGKQVPCRLARPKGCAQT